ncbi:Polycomb protein eed-A [Diplogelasinospora grovesii]|uniref:Polycomb protein eed-A n=1 Tax=Diplogelasinospora grovesii TaxID=303347 RepID=A0AAN6NBD3_9PEZI|nr:Polycomb protein eed-A [Diplogelasinospora grovesii]
MTAPHPRSPAALEPSEWELPKLRASFGFQDDFKYLASADELASQEFFDVKFYPYSPPGAAPIFAAVSKKHVVVCRLTHTTNENPCEIIRVIRDDDEEATNCTCTWSNDPVTERAWICIAGADAKVKVYNVKEGTLVRTFVGHGGGINDLATSPADPLIVASASDDTTVRIWSLAEVHKEQPCVCILGGEGHAWDLLSAVFHDTGRYILSAGHDQVINLWTLPDLPQEHIDVPVIVHYPHFSTSEVHSGLVDCVAFFGDLILSRACHEDSIVLWRIEGFSSDDPPPTPSQAPTAHDPAKSTRSAFAPPPSLMGRPALWTRLTQFHTPDCGVQFFLRFRVYHTPGRHPILAFCNPKSRTMFWDMTRLTEYSRFMEELKEQAKEQAHRGDRPAPPPERPAWLQVKKSKKPDNISNLRGAAGGGDKDSMVSASPDPEGAAASSLGSYDQKTLAEWAERYDVSNAFGMLKPHRVVSIEGNFVGRQIAWSPEGEWCVVVGNENRVLICQRWAQKPASSTPKASTPAAGG